MKCEDCGTELELYNIEDFGVVIVKSTVCPKCNASWEIEFEITNKTKVN